MDIKDILRKVLNVDEDFKDIERTVPMTKEEIKEYKDLEKAGEAARIAAERHSSLRNLFWAKIELKLSDYRTMRVNDDTWEIEIAAEKKNKRPIKSPLQVI